MPQPSRQMSADTDCKVFLDDYVERLHRVIRVDDAVVAQIAATREIWLQTSHAGRPRHFHRQWRIGRNSLASGHRSVEERSVPAACFSDASMMSCLANDYGFEEWLAHALRLNARAGDCLVAISSSGRSKNIINAVAKARAIGLDVITLSGMSPDNPLRELGDINYWADSRSYNIVETAHQFWMMAVIDLIIGRAEYPAS